MNYTASLILSACLALPSFAQSPTPLLAIGDSLGEGVQSANSFIESQPNTYVNLFAHQMGVPFRQPVLSTSFYAFIYSDAGRARLDPNAIPDDLAVSGATTDNVLTSVANTTPVTEYDLVLPPYFGMSQIQIVEQVKPKMVVAWVGNDDLTGLVLGFSTLNTNVPTPLATFTTEYQELVSRLKATGAQVVMANVPDLTRIGFLFDNDDLTKYTGTDYGLPAGSVTTLPTMVLLKLGVFGPDILKNPGYVLDPAGILRVRTLVQIYNGVIQKTANAAGFPVVDAYSILNGFIANPVTIEGITIGTHYNQGAFSLDGLHPSNFGYAVFANAFIAVANEKYGLGIPPISTAGLVDIFNNDPFIDFGGRGRVAGRPFTGLLDTLGPFLGLSGGRGHNANADAQPDPRSPVTAAAFMQRYFTAKGMNPSTPWTNQDVIHAVQEMFGLPAH